MDLRQTIEDWRKSNGKGEAEMATILGLGSSQQVYNKFKNNTKVNFPFEVAIKFLEVSGINLLDFTTKWGNGGEKKTGLQLLESLSKSTVGLEQDHTRLVRSHEMLVETKAHLIQRLLSLDGSGVVFSSLQETKPLMHDPTGGLKDISDIDSAAKEGKQKDTSENSDKSDN